MSWASQFLQARHNARESKKAKIAIVSQILNDSAIFPAIERSLAEAGNRSERGSGHAEPLPNIGDIGRRQYTQMPTYRIMSQSLPFVIEELKLT